MSVLHARPVIKIRKVKLIANCHVGVDDKSYSMILEKLAIKSYTISSFKNVYQKINSFKKDHLQPLNSNSNGIFFSFKIIIWYPNSFYFHFHFNIVQNQFQIWKETWKVNFENKFFQKSIFNFSTSKFQQQLRQCLLQRKKSRCVSRMKLQINA